MKIIKSIMGLSNIARFSTLKLLKPVNVAEHSYRVAMMGMLITDEYNSLPSTKVKINREEVLVKALFHDLEESTMTDIPAPLKQYGNLREVIREISYQVLDKEIIDQSLPNRAEYLRMWKEDKDGESGEVIIMADRIEALQTASREVKMGNIDAIPALNNIRGWFDTKEARTLMKKFPMTKKLVSMCDENSESVQNFKAVA